MQLDTTLFPVCAAKLQGYWITDILGSFPCVIACPQMVAAVLSMADIISKLCGSVTLAAGW